MKKMNEKEDDESCFGVLEENIFHPSHQGTYLPSKWKNLCFYFFFAITLQLFFTFDNNILLIFYFNSLIF